MKMKIFVLCLVFFGALSASATKFVTSIHASGTFERDEKGLYFLPALAPDDKVYLESNDHLQKMCDSKQVVKLAAGLIKNSRGDWFTENYCLKKVE